MIQGKRKSWIVLVAPSIYKHACSPGTHCSHAMSAQSLSKVLADLVSPENFYCLAGSHIPVLSSHCKGIGIVKDRQIQSRRECVNQVLSSFSVAFPTGSFHRICIWSGSFHFIGPWFIYLKICLLS